MNYYLHVLKNYVQFDGRARRSEYWFFFLFNMIISIGLSVLGTVMTELSFVSTIYSIAVLLPSIAVAIRRAHDVGKSGWFMLIPIYNLILACTAGDKGQNEYGSDPKESNTGTFTQALDGQV